jgi:glycosyltransferase involved in cell wall biosynthesis
MQSRLRVLQIVAGLPVENPAGSGITRFVISLCQALDRARFIPMIGALWSYDALSESAIIDSLRGDGIPAFAAAAWDAASPYAALWKSLRALASYVRTHPVDIVHSHSEFGDMAALWLKAKGDVRSILRTVHYGYGYEWRNRPWRRWLLTNLLYPLCFDLEAGVNRRIAQQLSDRPVAQWLRRQGLYLPNAIDLGRFAQGRTDSYQVRRTLNVLAASAVIGTVGRLAEQKGHWRLIETAAIVLRHHPQVHFLVVGTGDLETSLRAQAFHLGIDANVHFLGARADVELILQAIDIFVLPSLWEGLSTVIMESMASGVPVICSDLPANRDLVQAGVNGWLFPANYSPQSWAGVIIEALERPDLCRAYASRAFETVEAHSIENVARQQMKAYETLADRR